MFDTKTDSILNALLDAWPQNWRGDQLIVGANWTMVVITDPSGKRHAGLAASHRSQPEGPVDISGVDAAVLVQNVYSADPVRAGIGFAALNAILDPPPDLLNNIDAADWLVAHSQGRRVALVGHFPFIEELRSVAAQLWVLELNPLPGEFPAAQAANVIPYADIVAITGSTLINHTLGNLLVLPHPAAKVMLLGPTTPLSPLLFEYGVHVLSGVRIHDIEAASESVAQGLTFRQIRGLRRVTLLSNS